MRTRTLLRALSWFSDSVRFSRLFLKNWETQILILKICNWQSTFANLAMFIVRTQINYTFFHKIKLKKIRKTFITKHWYFKIYSNQNTFYYLLEIFGFLPITLKSLYNIVKSCYLISHAAVPQKRLRQKWGKSDEVRSYWRRANV